MIKTKWGRQEWFRIALAIILLLVLALTNLGSDNADYRTENNVLQENTNRLEEKLEKLEQENKQLKISKKKKQEAIKTDPQIRQQVVASAGCEQYRAEVSKYGWNVNIALAVMYAESGCNPNAASPTNDHGLMQLHGIRIYDPAQNIAYAYNNKYLQGGWSHWTVCTKGLVNCWL